MELMSTRAGGNAHRGNITSHITDQHTKNSTTVATEDRHRNLQGRNHHGELELPLLEIEQPRALTTSYGGCCQRAPSAEWTLCIPSFSKPQVTDSRKCVGVSDGTTAPLPDARKAGKVVLWHL